MRYLRLLRQRDPSLLWLGQLASLLGDRLYYVAALWMTYRITGSPAAVGAFAALGAIPLVIVGIAGTAITARWHPYRLLIGLDVLRAGLVALLPLVDHFGTLTIWHFLFVSLALSGAEALFRPTLKAVLPSLVAEDEIPSFLGLMDLTDRLARIIGPGSAGLVLLLIPEIHLFTLDAASFAVSAVSIATIMQRARVPAVATVREIGARTLARGLDYVRRDPMLRIAIGLRVIANGLWAVFTIGAPLIVASRFSEGLGGYGTMIAAYGVGTLTSNLVIGNARPRHRSLALGYLGWAIVGAGFVAVALAPALPLAVVATVWIGIGAPLAIIPTDIRIAQSVPEALRRQVYTLQHVAVEGVAVAAFLPAGVLLERLSVGTALALAGGALATLSLLALAKSARPRA